MATGRKLMRSGIVALLTFLLMTPILGRSPQSASAQTASADVEYEVLTEDTQDPLMIQVAPDGRVIWTEREGALKVLLPDGKQITAGRLPVSANQCDDCLVQDDPPLEEGGLHGLLLAKDFMRTGRLYLFRSVPGSRNPKTKFGVFRLSTFVLNDNNKLDKNSEKKILDVKVEWDHCCHYGGNLEWMPDGTILLSTGDDVPASSSGGYGAREKTNKWLNAELSVQNPADRRGKILRLMPDGSVPDGSVRGIAANPYIGQSLKNPYIPDHSGNKKDHKIKVDPYIYSIGYKQPFRGAVHPSTGTFYLGDVGPDAYMPDPSKGPRGHEEINVVPPGGGVNHGWPRCIADNQPYHDYNWKTSTDNGLLDCSKMTGVRPPLPARCIRAVADAPGRRRHQHPGRVLPGIDEGGTASPRAVQQQALLPGVLAELRCNDPGGEERRTERLSRSDRDGDTVPLGPRPATDESHRRNGRSGRRSLLPRVRNRLLQRSRFQGQPVEVRRMRPGQERLPRLQGLTRGPHSDQRDDADEAERFGPRGHPRADRARRSCRNAGHQSTESYRLAAALVRIQWVSGAGFGGVDRGSGGPPQADGVVLPHEVLTDGPRVREDSAIPK